MTPSKRPGVLPLSLLLLAAGLPAVAQLAPPLTRGVELEEASLIAVLVHRGAPPTLDALRGSVVFRGKGRDVEAAREERSSVPFLRNASLALSAEQLLPQERIEVAATLAVTLVRFTWPKTDTLGLPAAYRQSLRLLERYPGWLADLGLETLVPSAKWKRRADLTARPIDATLHFDVRLAAQPDGTVAMATVGLERFALANLTLEPVARKDVRLAHQLLRALGQRLVEGQRPEKSGGLTLKLSEVSHPGVKKELLSTVREKAPKEASLKLVPSSGDRPLLSVELPAAYGDSATARIAHATARLFGASRDVERVPHDAAALALSEKARQALISTWKPRLIKGLPPREALLVKAPFAHPGGTEWLWLEVTSWKGEEVSGVLENDPQYATSVRAGQLVTVKQGELFDFMYILEDGSFYGNETGRHLQPELFEELGNGRRRVRGR